MGLVRESGPVYDFANGNFADAPAIFPWQFSAARVVSQHNLSPSVIYRHQPPSQHV